MWMTPYKYKASENGSLSFKIDSNNESFCCQRLVEYEESQCLAFTVVFVIVNMQADIGDARGMWWWQ